MTLPLIPGYLVAHMAISLRLLDLFCGAGGASKGYSQYFDDIVGVDIKRQPKYPYRFIQADATAFPLGGFDLIHASPPCQDHSRTRFLFNEPDGTGWMLEHTLKRAIDQGFCYVVENVMDASVSDHPHSFTLCGSALGNVTINGSRYYLAKHRKFWSNFPVETPRCLCKHYLENGFRTATLHTVKSEKEPTLKAFGAVMGIDWMTLKEMNSALPPSYTRYIARAFMDYRGIPYGR